MENRTTPLTKFLSSMKIVRIIILIFSFAISASASTSQMVDSIIKVMPDGKIVARSVFRYDKRGYQTAAINYTLNRKTNKWVGTSSEEAIYDNNGNMTSKTTSIWNMTTQKWMHSEREAYRYNAQGRITSVEHIKWDKKVNKWIGIMHTTTTYGKRGEITSYQTFEWNNAQNKWEFSNKIVYEYDNQGRKLSETTQVHDDYGWYGVSRNEYEYSGKQLSSMTNYTGNGKVWTPSEYVTYTYKQSAGDKTTIRVQKKYDKDKDTFVDYMRQTTITDRHSNQLNQKVEMFSNGKWTLSRHEKSVLKYDGDGNLIYNEALTWDGQKWIGVTKSETTYNSYGDVMTEKELVWDTRISDWKGITNNEYDYDEMGNMTLSVTFKWDNSARKWVKQSKTIDIYDNYHNKVNETTSSWDKMKNTWNEYYKGKFEYTYTGDDEVSSVKEYAWNGSKWKPVSTTLYY